MRQSASFSSRSVLAKLIKPDTFPTTCPIAPLVQNAFRMDAAALTRPDLKGLKFLTKQVFQPLFPPDGK